jgi:TP901 family phage tail tape measure protein
VPTNSSLGLGIELVGKDKGAGALLSSTKKGLVEIQGEAKKTRDAMGRFLGDGGRAVGSASSGMARDLFKMHAAGTKAREGVKDLWEDVGKLGKRVALGGGAGLAAAFGVTAKSGELTDALAGLKSVSGATAEEMAMLRSTALDMGLSSEFASDKVATSLTDIASAGFTARDSINLLRPSLDLATASLGQLTSSESAALTAQALKAFGLEANQARPTVDKLVKTMNLFAVQARDLPLGLANSVRGAKAFNQTFDETLVSFGLVKNVIPRVETAATAVSIAMERMVSPDVQRDLKKLGVDVIDPTTKKFRPFLNVISDMAPALDKMGETKASGFLQETFGAEALTGINAILTQVRTGITTSTGAILKGGDALKYLRSEMGNANGTASAFTDELGKGLPGIMRQLRATGTTFIQMLGEPVAEAIRPGAQAVVSLLRSMSEVLRSTPREALVVGARFILLASTIVTLVGGLTAARAAWNVYRAGMLAVQATSIATASTMLPVVAGLAAVALGVAAMRYAVQNNIAGIGDLWEKTGGRISLVVRALQQHFSQGFISGSVKDELLKSGNGGLLGFVGRLVNYAERARSVLAGIGAGFEVGVAGLRPVLLSLTSALDSVGISFNGLLPQEGMQGLANARALGVRLGAALATLAGIAIRGAIVMIHLGRALGVVVGVGARVVEWAGGLNTVLTALEYVLVALAARAIAQASLSLLAMGTSAWAATGGVTGLLARLAAMRAMSISSAATSIAGGIGAITKSAIAANGPLIATTAALVALYLAMDQASKLGEELAQAEQDKRDAGYQVGSDLATEGGRSRDTLAVLGSSRNAAGVGLDAFENSAAFKSEEKSLQRVRMQADEILVEKYGERARKYDAPAATPSPGMPAAVPLPAGAGAGGRDTDALSKALGNIGLDPKVLATMAQTAQTNLEAAQINREAAESRRSGANPPLD